MEVDVVFSARSANGKRIAQIYRDPDPTDPREWDNYGIMVCKHRNYQLGDEQTTADSLEELEAELGEKGAVVILPLYLYDHSGITISTKSFSCQWDSSNIGYIYATRESIAKLHTPPGKKLRLTKKLLAQVREWLISEVETYDAYLTGDIYSIRVFEGGDVVDSCSDFYGLDDTKKQLEEAEWLGPGFTEISTKLDPEKTQLREKIAELEAPAKFVTKWIPTDGEPIPVQVPAKPGS